MNKNEVLHEIREIDKELMGVSKSAKRSTRVRPKPRRSARGPQLQYVMDEVVATPLSSEGQPMQQMPSFDPYPSLVGTDDEHKTRLSKLIGMVSRVNSTLMSAAQIGNDVWKTIVGKLESWATKIRETLEEIAVRLRAQSFSIGVSLTGISVSITFGIEARRTSPT